MGTLITYCIYRGSICGSLDGVYIHYTTCLDLHLAVKGYYVYVIAKCAQSSAEPMRGEKVKQLTQGLQWILLPVSCLMRHTSPEDCFQMVAALRQYYHVKYKINEKMVIGRKDKCLTNPGNVHKAHIVCTESIFVSSEWWTEKKLITQQIWEGGREDGREIRREGEIDVLCPASFAAVAIR